MALRRGSPAALFSASSIPDRAESESGARLACVVTEGGTRRQQCHGGAERAGPAEAGAGGNGAAQGCRRGNGGCQRRGRWGCGRRGWRGEPGRRQSRRWRQRPPAARADVQSREGGTNTVALPELFVSLKDRYEESWLASPAVADLDGDGKAEIIVAREGLVLAWHADGSVALRFDTGRGRIWASPVVGDFVGDAALEVAVAARDKIWLLDAKGAVLPGFPVTWEDEMRSLAAARRRRRRRSSISWPRSATASPTDVMNAWHADGKRGRRAFRPTQPARAAARPTASATSPAATTRTWPSATSTATASTTSSPRTTTPTRASSRRPARRSTPTPMFPAKKTPGVRYLHDLALAKQGYADDEETALQAHFTNTAPAIADIDGDGHVRHRHARQRAERLAGPTASSASGSGCCTPTRAASRAGRRRSTRRTTWPGSGTSTAPTSSPPPTRSPSPTSMPTQPGPEMIFAGFDGRIHAVGRDGHGALELRRTRPTPTCSPAASSSAISPGDGIPEIVFTTYSIDEGKGALFILDAGGNLLHALRLPHRGAMAGSDARRRRRRRHGGDRGVAQGRRGQGRERAASTPCRVRRPTACSGRPAAPTCCATAGCPSPRPSTSAADFRCQIDHRSRHTPTKSDRIGHISGFDEGKAGEDGAVRFLYCAEIPTASP